MGMAMGPEIAAKIPGHVHEQMMIHQWLGGTCFSVFFRVFPLMFRISVAGGAELRL